MTLGMFSMAAHLVPMMRGLALGCAIGLSAMAGATTAQGQTLPTVKALPGGTPASAIFIGNSFFYYNNGIHNQVGALLRSAEPKRPFRTTMATISGSGIDWHDVDSYFRPNAIGRYSFVGDNQLEFNKLDRLFDIAIIMDCSQCPVHPELGKVFTEFVGRHAASVRKHGAEPVLFMSWAYADKPEMTATLAEAYTRAGNQHNALVIPAGLAFARSIAKRPDLNLYAPDKRHPSALGTYLAAATVYAALTGKSPAGLAHTAGIDPSVAAFLRGIAGETVAEYRK